MSDLISRSEVIKIIDKIGYVNCECNKDFKANSRVDKIRQNVVEMPTALDLDEVMEELNQYRQIGTVDECNTAMGYVTPIKIGDIIYKIPSKTNYKINKLAEYEDMEEQGLFIHPPCKLKERLFAIWNEYGHKHIIEVEVKEISIGVYMTRKMILIKTEPISKRGRIYKFYGNDFAKVIFHSKEKAEQKLKEM